MDLESTWAPCVCVNPKPGSASHPASPGQDKWDYAIAEAFLERAYLEEGTNIYNSSIDGVEFEITETVMNLRCLPHRGKWAYDYVAMVDAAARRPV